MRPIKGIEKTSRQAFQWRLCLDQTQIYKQTEVLQTKIYFKNISWQNVDLGLCFEKKLNSNFHLKEKAAKLKRAIGLLRGLRNTYLYLILIFYLFPSQIMKISLLPNQMTNAFDICNNLDTSLAIAGAVRK